MARVLHLHSACKCGTFVGLMLAHMYNKLMSILKNDKNHQTPYFLNPPFTTPPPPFVTL